MYPTFRQTRGTVDRVALFTLHTGMIAWVFFPTFQPVGAVLLSAATLNLWRLMRWRGIATWAEPLVTILHVGYFWLVIGVALLGVSMLTGQMPEAAAIHALTAGAIGTMVLAVMTRVSLGHSGRALRADRITVLIYLLVVVAAAVRVVAAINGPFLPLIEISAVLWIGSFFLFTIWYGRILLTPPVSNLRIGAKLGWDGHQTWRTRRPHMAIFSMALSVQTIRHPSAWACRQYAPGRTPSAR